MTATCQRRWLPRLAAHGLLAAADVLALTGTLLLAEAATRANSTQQIQGLELRGLLENDGMGSVRTVPNFTTRQASDAGWIDISLNSLGLRGPEIGPPRTGEKRILVLGDSHVFGLGVKADETLSAALERQLRAQLGIPVVCANGGIPGNGTVELLRDLKRHQPAFQPDLTVLGVHLGTDFLDDVFGSREIVEGYALGAGAARFVKGSLRARLALRSRVWFELELGLTELAAYLAIPSLSMGRPELDEDELTRKADFPPPELCAGGVFMDAREESPAMTRILERTERGLAAIRDQARPGAVLVVLIPDWTSVFPGDYERTLRELAAIAELRGVKGFERERYEKGLCAKRLARRCQENLRLPCIDLTPFLDGHPEYYVKRFLHFSAEGSEFVAREVAHTAAILLAAPR